MLPGIAQPANQVTLSSPLEGTIAEILVTESSQVTEGELLVSLDSRELRANLALANASLERTNNDNRAELELKLAEQNLARTKQLIQQRAISQARLDQDEATAQVARTRLANAIEAKREAALQRDAVQAAIDQRTMRAPFAGVAIRVDAQVGQTVRRAEPVVTLINLERLKTDLHVPSSRMNEYEIGQTYQLWAAAPLNRVIDAQLVSMEPIVDAATRTFRCRFEINNQETQFPAGFPVALIAPHQVARDSVPEEMRHSRR